MKNESIRPIPNLKGLNSSAKNVLFNKTAEITTGCLQLKIFLISLWFNFEIFSTKDSHIRSRVGKNILFKDLPSNDVNDSVLLLNLLCHVIYTRYDRKRVRSFGGLRLTNVIISHQQYSET